MTAAATTKAAVGYQTASKRPECRNCSHSKEDIADRMPPYDTSTWSCKKHGFRISPLAICNDYKREAAAAADAKQGSTAGAAHQLSPDQAEPTSGR